jgi:regulator of sirC expression with transglutaminase-like and TPR domain
MNLDTALQQLADHPDAPLDLAELALTLACDEYPDLDVEAYLAELDGMAHEARHLLRGGLTARVRGLGRYLFHDMGFRGNARDYYDPRNSYLNEVLDRRTGIPIALSAVALAVGRRAGLTLLGVGLPGHFVVKAVEDGEEVLFDPFHGGRLLTPPDCERLVEQSAGTPFKANPHTLAAAPLGQVVGRMLTNLKAVYWRGGEFEKAAKIIGRLRQLQPRDIGHLRDLGATLLQAGLAGEALTPLAAYLAQASDADDASAVRDLLRQARREVAQWN